LKQFTKKLILNIVLFKDIVTLRGIFSWLGSFSCLALRKGQREDEINRLEFVFWVKKGIRSICSFFFLAGIKVISHIFYRCNYKWIGPQVKDPWGDIRILVFLNHTSLYEPLYLSAMPFKVLWKIAFDVIAPAADITLNRPIVGKFFKIFSSGLIPVSRKRDSSWDHFLSLINQKSFIVILPEGRMKRPSGMDKEGRPMSVRGGVADIFHIMKAGKMVFAYSGGLHHVQVPGQRFPKIFKEIRINLELLDLEEYLKALMPFDDQNFKPKVIADLEERTKSKCPNNIGL
jgi:1-acyl-sn-glycerol-3-phosphate acyltransferase